MPPASTGSDTYAAGFSASGDLMVWLHVTADWSGRLMAVTRLTELISGPDMAEGILFSPESTTCERKI